MKNKSLLFYIAYRNMRYWLEGNVYDSNLEFDVVFCLNFLFAVISHNLAIKIEN
jgi:hypothetical protein